MFVPLTALLIAGINIAGTHKATSQFASLTNGISSFTRAVPLSAVMFIFQLPAIKGFLIFLPNNYFYYHIFIDYNIFNF
jgi:hypothetical protein